MQTLAVLLELVGCVGIGYIITPVYTITALVITAVGLTVTVSVKGVPAQPLTLGVMIYATATGSVVVLIRVSVIVAVVPLPWGY